MKFIGSWSYLCLKGILSISLISLSDSILFNDCLNNLAEIIGISLGTEILFFKYLREIPESFLGINTSPVIIFVKALTNMITGEVLIPKKLSGISLRYLKNRISVPRDMPIISARLLRQSLNKIESLSDINEIDKIPFRHRYDQDPINFISN